MLDDQRPRAQAIGGGRGGEPLIAQEAMALGRGARRRVSISADSPSNAVARITGGRRVNSASSIGLVIAPL